MFHNRLRETRERRELTQQELGARVGVSGQQIYRYEKGENEPDASILSKLAKELEVSADYLLGLVDDSQGHISEVDLPDDEREALLAYRAHKAGNSQRILGILAKQTPNTS